MRLFKSAVALVGATVLLSGLVASVSARNLSVSERSVQETFLGAEFSGGFGTTRCNLTVRRVFPSRTMSKVSELYPT